MSGKIIFVVGVGALVVGVVFFLMGVGASRPGSGAAAPDTERLQEELTAANKEIEELKAQLVTLQEQLGAGHMEGAPVAEETLPGSEGRQGPTEHISQVEKIRKGLGSQLEKYARFMAKILKAEQEGKGPSEFMNNPEMLEMQADMLKLMANLQRELGISTEFLGGSLFISLVLEPLCKELGMELSPEQSQKLQAMNTGLIENLLKVKESASEFEVEKAYGRNVAIREFNKGMKDFLTEEQKKKLGFFGRGFGDEPSMWTSNRYGLPKKPDDLVQAWQGSFGIEEDKHAGALTSIAQEYLASYEDLERKYGTKESEREQLEEFILRGEGVERTFGETRGLTDQQKEEKERELVEMEVETLRKISQLELTEEQQESVRNHNPFSPWAGMYRRSSSYGGSAEAAVAISKLRTLSSAQELYNTRHERYAETFDELQEMDYIDKSFSRDEKYTYELTTVSKDEWSAIATPSDWSERHFYIDQTGAIRYEEGRSAGPDSPVLGG